MDILNTFPDCGIRLIYKMGKLEALTNISVANILKFFKRNVLAKYGIPKSILKDNMAQFIVDNLKVYLRT